MEIKKQAKSLKEKAKTLGYDIKLTHAQEMVAHLEGHKSRHSALLEDKSKTDMVKLDIDKLSKGTNDYIAGIDKENQQTEYISRSRAKGDIVREYAKANGLPIVEIPFYQSEDHSESIGMPFSSILIDEITMNEDDALKSKLSPKLTTELPESTNEDIMLYSLNRIAKELYGSPTDMMVEARKCIRIIERRNKK